MTPSTSLPEQISQQPRIYVAEDFVSAAEIDHVLMGYGTPGSGAAAAIDWGNGIAGVSGELPLDADPLLAGIAGRIDELLGFTNTLGTGTFRFRRYAIGDYHPAHVDCYTVAGHSLVATALIYLTDALDGGETVFPAAEGGEIAIGARRGRMALWFNYAPDGEIDQRSRHRSEELRRGDKATIAYFVYAPLACAAATVPTAGARTRVAVCA